MAWVATLYPAEYTRRLRAACDLPPKQVIARIDEITRQLALAGYARDPWDDSLFPLPSSLSGDAADTMAQARAMGLIK